MTQLFIPILSRTNEIEIIYQNYCSVKILPPILIKLFLDSFWKFHKHIFRVHKKWEKVGISPQTANRRVDRDLLFNSLRPYIGN
jgi:hypothetical protein